MNATRAQLECTMGCLRPRDSWDTAAVVTVMGSLLLGGWSSTNRLGQCGARVGQRRLAGGASRSQGA